MLGPRCHTDQTTHTSRASFSPQEASSPKPTFKYHVLWYVDPIDLFSMYHIETPHFRKAWYAQCPIFHKVFKSLEILWIFFMTSCTVLALIYVYLTSKFAAFDIPASSMSLKRILNDDFEETSRQTRWEYRDDHQGELRFV